MRISPAARKLARAHGVDPSRIKGTGPGGRIVREDVMRAAQGDAKPASSAVDEGRPGVSVPITRIRRSIADNMARSAHTVARVVHFAEIDMTRAVDYRNQNRESFKKEVDANTRRESPAGLPGAKCELIRAARRRSRAIDVL